MENERNVIPSSEDTEPEIITSNIDELNEPSPTNTENECQINCTDDQSLRNILGITLNQIEELADSCELKDSRSEFVSVFSEAFKNALQENILVNGLPLMIDQSKTLSAPEKEDRLHMVDDVLFGKLSKRVANVAQERKFSPEQCCRILNIEMKHELQNLKKTKVIDSSLPSTSSISSLKEEQTNLRRPFSDFCQRFGSMQEDVQYKLQEKEKLAMKLSLAKEIKEKQKLDSKSSDKSSNLK